MYPQCTIYHTLAISHGISCHLECDIQQTESYINIPMHQLLYVNAFIRYSVECKFIKLTLKVLNF